MAINSIGQNYYSGIYQWQRQQLQGMSSTGSSRSSSTGSTGYSQSELGSLVELANYAMNAMGVGRNERVTFGQIQKYKEQLEQEFSKTLKAGLDSVGIDTTQSFELTLSKDGALQVSGNHPDKAAIQELLNSNPEVGKSIRNGLDELGISEDTSFRLRMDSSGIIKVVNTGENKLQKYFDDNKNFGTDIRKDLEALKVDVKTTFQLTMDENGALQVKGDHPDKEKIQQYFDEHPEVAGQIREQLEEMGLEYGDVHLAMGTDGAVTAENVVTEDIKKLQQYFNENLSHGKNILEKMNNSGIDPDINFQLTMDEDGNLVVISDHPDKDKVQKFFDEHPELAKKYEQIQALANLDSARKAMQISPSAMRKRIQVESLASWWDTSGNSTSSIGDFMGGDLAFYNGLNSRV